MSIQYPDLVSLNPDAVAAKVAEVASRIKQLYPGLDTRRGGIHDSLIYPHAALETGFQQLLDQHLQSKSLLLVQQNPELADEETVDLILANWRLSRFAATPAYGQLLVALDSAINTTLPVGMTFVGDGQVFRLPEAISAKATASLVLATTDRLLRPAADGTFVFQVPVVAVENGAAGNLREGTAFLPSQTLRGFVSAVAQADFVGGRDKEATTDLLTRLESGAALRSPSNRPSIRATLSQLPELANLSAVSIVGMGDAEMRRDARSLFPISFGGRSDIYVRTLPTDVIRSLLSLPATLLEVTGNQTSRWQLFIDRDAAPGFYELDGVWDTASAAVPSFAVLSDMRGFQTVPAQGDPDLQTATEAAYSAYQTAAIEFEDTRTTTADLTVGDVRYYDVRLKGLPGLLEAQRAFSDRTRRHAAADYLVRAAVPCFVSVSLRISKRALSPAPDLDALKAAIVDNINRTPFVGRLAASDLHAIVHEFVDSTASVSYTQLTGRVRQPNGDTFFLQSATAITVPDAPAAGVSARTVQFFAGINDIDIVVRSDIPAEE